MQNRSIVVFLMMMAAEVLLLRLALPSIAPNATRSEAAGPAPRWPDGRANLGAPPGEKGVWTPTGIVQLAINPKSVNPANPNTHLPNNIKIEDVPFQPWARDLFIYRQRNFMKDDPMFLDCKPQGGPRIYHVPYGIQFLEERERIQQLRQRSDETIFALFRRPFAPVARDAEYLEASLRLRGALGLDELYARQRVTSVLVIAGAETRRLRTLARNASAFAPVVFASSSPPTRIQGVGITAIRESEHLAELVSESDCVLMDGLVDDNGVVSQQTRGLLLVDVARGTSAVDPALLRRGDVFFCNSEQHRRDFIRAARTHSNGDVERRVLVLPDEDGPQKAILREVLREPWRWQRDGDAPGKVAIPEDLQLLLRTWREQYTRAARSRHLARALWRRLPAVVQKMVHRLVWRP